MNLTVTTVRVPNALSPTESATETGEFRSSAAFPLPRLRPVADFVALPTGRRYVTVAGKFGIAAAASALWLVLAAVGAWLAVPAMRAVVPGPIGAVLFVLLVAVPGMLLTFSLVGVLLDRPPTPAIARPALPVTVAITARNQPRSVVETLESLRAQDYDGALTYLLVDSGSTDATLDEATRAAARLGIRLRVVVERRPLEAQARNAAAACTDTPLLVVVRAGTVLHPSAVRLLVARLLRSPSDTAAVSAHALVRNARNGELAEAVAYDYSVNVHASQRVQGLFQAPLVAEGSCSLFRTDAVRAVGGWTRDDHDGVMITWRFLERGWRVFQESLAVAFTTEPVTVGSWAARRVRAANAIVEGARAKGIRSLRFPYNRFVALVDATGPLVDGLCAGAGVLALALAMMGAPQLVTAYVLLVLPVSVALTVVTRRVARHALDDVGLRVPGGPRAWLGFGLGLHPVQAALGAGSALAQVFGRRVH
jgi:biofilm PGA synthesis N-glycosyltransferase PgaC